MSEWSIVQSWNGCVRKRTSGSNPDLCAKNSPFMGLFYLPRLDVCVAHNCFQQLFEPVFVASLSASTLAPKYIRFRSYRRIPKLFRQYTKSGYI